MSQTYEIPVPEYPKQISRFICEEMEGTNEYIYIHEEDGAALTLNATASAVFDMCDGQHSAKDMAEVIADTLQVPKHDTLKDVESILEELAGFGFFEEKGT